MLLKSIELIRKICHIHIKTFIFMVIEKATFVGRYIYSYKMKRQIK